MKLKHSFKELVFFCQKSSSIDTPACDGEMVITSIYPLNASECVLSAKTNQLFHSLRAIQSIYPV